ncbi:MAG: AI-2E family transporter [Gracilibacteraceae bacterium]|jgi:predicted PurR-regulated permease PerM|nr:AI-2E family transporter [Gracilibacteraceae bacterium]
MANNENRLDGTARIISIGILVVILLTIWYMLDLVLLTFVITFIFYHLLQLVHNVSKNALRNKIPDSALLVVLYLAALGGLSVASIRLAPVLMAQINAIAKIIREFDLESFVNSLTPVTSLAPSISSMLKDLDIAPYLSAASAAIVTSASKFGEFSVNILLAILLSLLLLLEKDKIAKFGEALSASRISFLYGYCINFGANFVQSFSNVMKVQVVIAFINCGLSMIVLSFLHFPQIMGLGIMIFVLGLIPVAGVVISLIPLSVVAFQVGGVSMILVVIIMIAVIHAIEAYVLNPKLMSEKTSLPVSFVFVILVVAEHYLKVWGLLIGVPLFIFFLTIFEVDYKKVFAHKNVSPFAKFRRKKQS